MKNALLVFLVFLPIWAKAQERATELEDLKKEVLALKQNVDQIQVNLVTAENRFKRGILISTIGYSVTIAGGLMLGREQDNLGKALLIAGGITGVTGTVLLIDAFKFLGKAGRKTGFR